MTVLANTETLLCKVNLREVKHGPEGQMTNPHHRLTLNIKFIYRRLTCPTVTLTIIDPIFSSCYKV